MNFYPLRELFPAVYKDVLEIDELAEIEQRFLDESVEYFHEWFFNNFVRTANERGVKDWEALLNISPLPGETLEQRKDRIFAKLLVQVRYTMPYLLRRLDSYFGAGNVDAQMIYGERKLIIEGRIYSLLAVNFNSLMSELVHTIPANVLLDLFIDANVEFTSQQYHGHTQLQTLFFDIDLVQFNALKSGTIYHGGGRMPIIEHIFTEV